MAGMKLTMRVYTRMTCTLCHQLPAPRHLVELGDDEPPQQLEEEGDGQGRQAPEGQRPRAHGVQQGDLLGPPRLAGARVGQLVDS